MGCRCAALNAILPVEKKLGNGINPTTKAAVKYSSLATTNIVKASPGRPSNAVYSTIDGHDKQIMSVDRLQGQLSAKVLQDNPLLAIKNVKLRSPETPTVLKILQSPQSATSKQCLPIVFSAMTESPSRGEAAIAGMSTREDGIITLSPLKGTTSLLAVNRTYSAQSNAQRNLSLISNDKDLGVTKIQAVAKDNNRTIKAKPAGGGLNLSPFTIDSHGRVVSGRKDGILINKQGRVETGFLSNSKLAKLNKKVISTSAAHNVPDVQTFGYVQGEHITAKSEPVSINKVAVNQTARFIQNGKVITILRGAQNSTVIKRPTASSPIRVIQCKDLF